MGKNCFSGYVLPEDVLKQYDATWNHKPVAATTDVPAVAVKRTNSNGKWKAHLSNTVWRCEINQGSKDYHGLSIQPLAVKYYCQLNGKFGPWRIQCALNFLGRNNYDLTLENLSKYLDGSLWKNTAKTSAERLEEIEKAAKQKFMEDEKIIMSAQTKQTKQHLNAMTYQFRHQLELDYNLIVTMCRVDGEHQWNVGYFTRSDVFLAVNIHNGNALADLLNHLEEFDQDNYALYLISKRDYSPTDAVDEAKEVKKFFTKIHDELLNQYFDPRYSDDPDADNFNDGSDF